MKHIYGYFLVATMPLWAQTSPTINSLPSREFGQPKLLQTLNSVAPNLVEGRELSGPTSLAFDTNAKPPILYVVDSLNNRVLAWRNSSAIGVCGTSAPTCGFADLVIGQLDLFSTLASGPAVQNAFNTGLFGPSAVAVDSQGNVYVADSGNNRILRYPAPFSQTTTPLIVDLVIGQKNPSSGVSPNQGQPAPSATTLALSISQNNHLGPIGMAFDSSGNLWVPDTGNNRVLRFPASQLTPNNILPTADMVLGQSDFVTGTVAMSPPNTNPQINNQIVVAPTSVAFDQKGRLYVTDALARVLYYGPATVLSAVSAKALRELGLDNQQIMQTDAVPAQYPNKYTLGAINSSGQFLTPGGVFTLNNNLYVCDSLYNRIAIYDIPDNWPTATPQLPSPPIMAVLGQPDMQSGKANGAKREPDATVFAIPSSGAFNGTDMWIADAANNRVLGFKQQSGTYMAASMLLGQLDFPFDAANLIEGKEVFFFSSGSGGAAGIVVDRNSNPPHLYVSDFRNNRVLGFNDARVVQQGTKADLVIGQTDFFRALVNSGTSDPTVTNDSGLSSPVGLVVDANGDLFVADSGNDRVLRFPAPFSQKPGAVQHANLVLGQQSFTGFLQTGAGQATTNTPWGLALLSNGTLAVSDAILNRVTIFKRTNGDFTNGQPASSVLGQPNFFSSTAATATSTTPASLAGMNSPRGIASDNGDRLYVCDSSNNRMLVFTSSTNQPNGANAQFAVNNLTTAQGVVVNPDTSEIWVAATGLNEIFRFPAYTTLVLNPMTVTAAIPSPAPLTVALDAADNVIAAEASNRITFYFPQIIHQNAANYNSQALAPGMLALMYRLGQDLNLTPASAQTLPWPTTLSDLQLTVNGTPAVIFRVDRTDVAFMVPSNAPTSGTADFVLSYVSTGEIIGAASLPMAAESPGFFTSNAMGTGQIAAVNFDDGTINGPSNPVARGSVIILYLTGLGVVPGAPPDGSPPTGSLPTQKTTGVITACVCYTSDNIKYSGLGGGYPGLWQINLLIPQAQATTASTGGVTTILVTLDDVPSNIGPGGNLIKTTFWVK